MNKLRILTVAFAAISFLLLPAQDLKNYQQGNPQKPEYDYLKDLAPLKNYINKEKYPNFRLGIGTTVNNYLSDPTVEGLTNDNFTETVAGNAMKMSSCVSNSGTMDFTTVKKYVDAADNAGLNIFGHTLAWHSQQPTGWLQSLIKDRPSAPFENPDTIVNIAVDSKDFRTQQNVGWTSDKTQYEYSLNFSSTNGLNIHTTKTVNFWEVQFIGYSNIPIEPEKTYTFTYTIKGSDNGTLHTKLGDWSNGAYTNFDFTTDWTEVSITYQTPVNTPFLLIQCGDFIGDIYIRDIKIEEQVGAMIAADGSIQLPQSTKLTQPEKLQILTDAMEQWIKGMMEACDGKVKAWDVVNEAIAGKGSDGTGFYPLQHADANNGDNNDAFYWQDHMGDLEYVRTAVRLARKYGPGDVKLFINDYNLESDWDGNTKLNSLINWINKWEADGETHIDGIGTQMHISYYEKASTMLSKKNYISNMFKRMAATGKLVRISELDMGYVNEDGRDLNTADLTEKQHQNMADFYEWIIKEYLRLVPAAQQWGICFWCPTDSPANSYWRAKKPVGIWTEPDYYRKHVYAGIVRGLGSRDYSSVPLIPADPASATSANLYTISGLPIPASVPFTSLPSGLYIRAGKLIRK